MATIAAAMRWPGSGISTPDGVGRGRILSCPYPVQDYGSFRAPICPRNGEAFFFFFFKFFRNRQRFQETSVNQEPADPSLNLEFVDEAPSLVRDAEANGIRLPAFWVESPIACNAQTICIFSSTEARPPRRGFRGGVTGQSATFWSRADSFRMKAFTWRRRADATSICIRTPV